MFVHFTTNHIKYYLPKIINSALKIAFFSIFMGFQSSNANVFHGFGNLVILLWKSFVNMLRVVCTNTACKFPCLITVWF